MLKKIKKKLPIRRDGPYDMEAQCSSPVIDHALYSNLTSHPAGKISKLIEAGLDLVIVDFDKTITTCDSHTPWTIFDTSSFSSKETKTKMAELYAKHCPIEISEKYAKSEKEHNALEWYEKTFVALSLEIPNTTEMLRAFEYIDHNVEGTETSESVENAEKKIRIAFKNGFIRMLQILRTNDIPCLIYSAGIGDFIVHMLKKYDTNMFGAFVVSNFRTFKKDAKPESTFCDMMRDEGEPIVYPFADKPATGWTSPYVHCSNKNMQTLKTWIKNNESKIKIPHNILETIERSKNIILIGDVLSDSHMSDGLNEDANIIKICFHERMFNAYKRSISSLNEFHEKTSHDF